jgi:excisionase family DNA binding protein
MTDEFLTVDEVAARLRVPRRTILKACKAGEMRAARFGQTWRIKADSADQWIEAALSPVSPVAIETQHDAKDASNDQQRDPQ